MDAQVANLASRPWLRFLHASCQICSAELLCPRAHTTLSKQRRTNISVSSEPTGASPGRSCWRGCGCFCPMQQSRLGHVGAEECSAYLTGSNTVLPCQTQSSIFYSKSPPPAGIMLIHAAAGGVKDFGIYSAIKSRRLCQRAFTFPRSHDLWRLIRLQPCVECTLW